MVVRLSKSKVMSSLQCKKQLHLKVYRPELEEISDDVQARFTAGNEVRELAREVLGCAGGVFVDRDKGVAAALETTQVLVDANTPAIYEAAFQHENVLVFVDILRREEDGWRVVEVKSSTSIKLQHHSDCAVQTRVVKGAGIKVIGTSLAHVDNTFVYQGDHAFEGLLKECDVTGEIEALLSSVPQWVADASRAVADADDIPDVPVGEHCNKPYTCGFFNHCWPNRTTYPVPKLGGKKAKLAQLVHKGYEDIRQVPAEELSKLQQRIQRVTQSGEPELLEGAIEFARSLAYPRYYLDFETIGPAIPVWRGTQPYKAQPFQWSCHVEEAPGSMCHEEFLEFSQEPTMRRVAETMLEVLGDEGPILTYSSYEKTTINGLAAKFSDLAPALEVVVARLVDLYPVTKMFYYHPKMLGSWSIKAVLPTVAPDIDYKSLDEIQDGTSASRAFIEAIDPSTSEERSEFIRHRLLDYCRLDTEAMVQLLRFLASGGAG